MSIEMVLLIMVLTFGIGFCAELVVR